MKFSIIHSTCGIPGSYVAFVMRHDMENSMFLHKARLQVIPK